MVAVDECGEFCGFVFFCVFEGFEDFYVVFEDFCGFFVLSEN